MANQELLTYIKQQLTNGVSRVEIETALLQNDWSKADVDEVFLTIQSAPAAPRNTESVSSADNQANSMQPSNAQPANFTQATQEQTNSQAIKYAGFWIRWVAMAVDGIVLGTVFFLLSLLIGFSGSELIKNEVFVYSLNFMSFIITWIYYSVMTYYKGATLGKMLVGIEVRSENLGRLSLGKIILRETIGKIISYTILFIGYIMVAFTKKKQGLHDKIANTVVVYKDPHKEGRAGLIVGIILAAILPTIAILGILSSVILASLNSAREKSGDAMVKSTIASSMIEAVIHADLNSNYYGFVSNRQMADCSEPLTINISPNGNRIAIFGKSCVDENTYFCSYDDLTKNTHVPIREIQSTHVTKDKFDCE